MANKTKQICHQNHTELRKNQRRYLIGVTEYSRFSVSTRNFKRIVLIEIELISK